MRLEGSRGRFRRPLVEHELPRSESDLRERSDDSGGFFVGLLVAASFSLMLVLAALVLYQAL